MTTVAAVMARSFAPDMFADLPVVLLDWSRDRSSGVTTLTFDGVLSVEVVATIRARMTSRDGADLTARAHLAALRDAEPFDAAALLVALTDYTLGEAP